MAANMEMEEETDLEKSVQEAVDTMDKHGVSSLSAYAKDKKIQWVQTDINIGISGGTGAGKSTFINAYRNLDPHMEGFAPVGEVDTTKKAIPYPHPLNEKIQLHDLPGLGSIGFGRDKYLAKVDLSLYDFIIIITSTRFRDDDLWLYNMLRKKRKPVFLVRTKMIQDANQKMAREDIDEFKALEVIKQQCKQEIIEAIAHSCYEAENDKQEDETARKGTRPLPENSTLEPRIYFIDSFEREHVHLDFSILMIDLANSLPSAKHDAMLLTLELHTPMILQEKYKTLKSRIFSCSLLASSRGFTCGLAEEIDISSVTEETEFLKHQLGLHKDMLQIMSSKTSVKSDQFHQISKRWNSQGIDNIMKELGISLEVEKSQLSCIPIFAPIASVIKTFKGTYKVLSCILDKAYQDGNAIYNPQTVSEHK